VFPQLLRIGSFSLPTYGLLVALGFLLGLLVASRLARRSGLDPEQVANLGIYSAAAGILGAKLFLIVSDFSYYRNNPRDIFSLATLQAGGVFFGGLIVALAVALWYLRRRGLPALPAADALAPGAALGHAAGRLGCFLAGCCWGRPAELPWSVTFTNPVARQQVGVPLGVALHPAQLYEAAAELAIFALLWWLYHRLHRPGAILGWYLVLYPGFRLAIEFVRDRQEFWFPFAGPFSMTQWIALALTAAGCALLLRRPAERRPAS